MASEKSPLLYSQEEETINASSDPHHLQESKRSGILATCANLFKGNLGSAILGLPYAFHQSGIWAGLVGMPIICFLSIHCSKLLIDCKRKLQEKKDINYSFGDVGKESYGSLGSWMVDGLLMFTQTGFSCAYVIFISENMHIIVNQLTRIEWALAILPLLWFLCVLRTLKYLAPFSLMANFTLLFSIGVVYYHDFTKINSPIDLEAVNWSSLPIFFGVAVYSYEGIGLVLPVESSMREPKKFMPVFYGIINFYSFLLITFGFFGYLRYGEKVESLVTFNLGEGIMTTVIRVMLSFSLLMTFPVQLFPVIEIIEYRLWFQHKNKVAWLETKRNLMRISLATGAMAVAIVVPHFGLFIGLIGSLGSSALAFVIPCLFHLKIFKGELSLWIQIKNWALIVFGVIGGVVGTVITVKDLASYY